MIEWRGMRNKFRSQESEGARRGALGAGAQDGRRGKKASVQVVENQCPSGLVGSCRAFEFKKNLKYEN